MTSLFIKTRSRRSALEKLGAPAKTIAMLAGVLLICAGLIELFTRQVIDDGLLLPVDILVSHFPEQTLAAEEARRFCHGQAVRGAKNCATMQRFRVYQAQTREFLGLADASEDGLLQPVRVMVAPATE